MLNIPWFGYAFCVHLFLALLVNEAACNLRFLVSFICKSFNRANFKLSVNPYYAISWFRDSILDVSPRVSSFVRLLAICKLCFSFHVFHFMFSISCFSFHVLIVKSFSGTGFSKLFYIFMLALFEIDLQNFDIFQNFSP